MSKVLRIIGILVVVLALIGAGFMFMQRRQAEAEADEVVVTAPVTRGDIREVVSATGNVVADRQATLTFASSGSIAEVLVEKGQEVEAGEVLARLDTSTAGVADCPLPGQPGHGAGPAGAGAAAGQ